MGDEYHGEDSPQDHDDEIDRLKQKITDLETEIERLRADRKTYDAWAAEIKIGIENMRVKNDRLREALRRIDIGQSIEPDHWKFRCRAREIASDALSTSKRGDEI